MMRQPAAYDLELARRFHPRWREISGFVESIGPQPAQFFHSANVLDAAVHIDWQAQERRVRRNDEVQRFLFIDGQPRNSECLVAIMAVGVPFRAARFRDSPRDAFAFCKFSLRAYCRLGGLVE